MKVSLLISVAVLGRLSVVDSSTQAEQVASHDIDFLLHHPCGSALR
jgi:hypothetical protein